MNYKNLFFKKIIIILFSLLLLIAVIIKIHSVITFKSINDWNYYQLKKNDKNKNSFSFDVFGDNKNSGKTFENLINKVNKDDVCFSIDIGDLVYDGEMEKFRFFMKQIKYFKKPLLTAIGNHEVKEKGRANYYILFGKFYYSFFVGNSYFIVLDDSNERNLDPEQMDWLKRELKKSKRYKHLFVFMHVPLYDPRAKKEEIGHSLKDLTFTKKLNKLFDKYNVTMLFTSHIHAYYKGIWSKTPYIITGGAGAELAGLNSEHYFYHYIKVTVDNDKVAYKVIKLKTPDFELLDRLFHDAWIYIYAFFVIHFWDAVIITSLFYLLFYIVFVKGKMLLWNFKRKKHSK